MQSLFGDATPEAVQLTGAVYVHGTEIVPDVGGSVVGLRFYKTVAMSGVHNGGLYDTFGNLLKSVTFSETASGWQTAYFDSAYHVLPATPYVAAVNYADGVRIATIPFDGLVNEHLYATTESGCYAEGGVLTYPNQRGSFAIYVDFLFEPSVVPPTSIPLASIATLFSGLNNIIDEGSTEAIRAVIQAAMDNGDFGADLYYYWTPAEAVHVKNMLATLGYSTSGQADGDSTWHLFITWPRR